MTSLQADLDAVISDRASLAAARGLRDLDTITVRTARLKHRNLMPCALKYALWAVKPGGRIVVEDRGPDNPAPPSHVLSKNIGRQWIGIFLGRDVEWESISPDGRIVLVRRTPILEPGWSAGVVFSGRDAEIPTLLKCLEGLALQPELGLAAGGEIFVCGPQRDLDFLKAFPDVRYHVFETPPGDRLLIGRKKNALMGAMKGPRMVVLHARIVLGAGALSSVPREFDMSSPDTTVLVDGRHEQYLSLIQSDALWPGRPARLPVRMLRHLNAGDPLALHEAGPVFVDGGAFYATKRLFEACPMSDTVAWNEAEDVEWCARAWVNGFLCDLAPDSRAVSQTSKLKPRPRLGAATPFAYLAKRMKESLRGHALDAVERLAKRR